MLLYFSVYVLQLPFCAYFVPGGLCGSFSTNMVVCYRLTSHFLVHVGQGELRKQWTWEPRMGESLFLSLIDPNDVIIGFQQLFILFIL